MRIVKFKYEQTDLFIAAMQIRTVVFVDEQKVPADLESDGKDPEADHYLLFIDDLPVGTARRRFTDYGIKLERLAVLQEHRGRGYAHELMKYLMEDCLLHGKRIYMHAQKGVEDIYKKYGFAIVGEKFTEAGIEHYKMEYQNI
jgi:predicted GNAT family N-acyltransferase